MCPLTGLTSTISLPGAGAVVDMYRDGYHALNYLWLKEGVLGVMWILDVALTRVMLSNISLMGYGPEVVSCSRLAQFNQQP